MVRPQGPGIILTNKSKKKEHYAFYNNLWNGDGKAGANFDHPDPQVTLEAGESKWIGLSEKFKGRVQRGTEIPATWAEFQVAADDGKAWGDISLQQGCDGAATIKPTDGGHTVGGFTEDIVKDAPATACTHKPDGQKALQTTVGNWSSGPNQAAIEWEKKHVGQQKAYIVGGSGTIVVQSSNKCLAVDFY